MKKTGEFQLVAELITAKVFLVISLVTFPTKLPREIIFRTRWRFCELDTQDTGNPDKSSVSDLILLCVALCVAFATTLRRVNNRLKPGDRLRGD